MLRNALLLFTLGVAGLGFVLIAYGLQAWPVAIWGSVLFVLILLERWRYQHSHSGDEEGWAATDEQFIDPETGKLTRVFYKAASGERRYVAVDGES